MSIGILIVYLLMPIAIIYGCMHNKTMNKIGAAPLAYLIGIIISISGILPLGVKGSVFSLMEICVPLAIPLMLFSMDFFKWSKMAGKSLLSFGMMILALIIVNSLTFVFLGGTIPEASKVSGMLMGVYTGGTPNMNAIGLAVNISPDTLLLVNTADIFLGTIWMTFILYFGKSFFSRFLISKSDTLNFDKTQALEVAQSQEFTNYTGFFQPKVLLGLLVVFGLTIIIMAISISASSFVSKDYTMAILMLSLTSLSIMASFVPKIRNIKMSFQLGNYFILVFCLAVSSLSDLGSLVSGAAGIGIYVGVVMFGTFILHGIFAKLCKIDVDTYIITATAGIMSPPLVPPVAAVLKSKDALVSGIAAGILGYAIGNYLGIAMTGILSSL